MVVESSPASSSPSSSFSVPLHARETLDCAIVTGIFSSFLPSFIPFFLTLHFLLLLLLLPSTVFAAKLFPSGGKTLENGELERANFSLEREREKEREKSTRSEAAGERLSNSWKTAFMVNCWSNVRVLSWACREGSGKQIFERRYDVLQALEGIWFFFRDFQNF